jgi:hypothetical protein
MKQLGIYSPPNSSVQQQQQKRVRVGAAGVRQGSCLVGEAGDEQL